MLKLPEYKELYRVVRTGIPPIDHLILGVLVWVEERVIHYRAVEAVDRAVEEYKEVEPPMPDVVAPIVSEVRDGSNPFGVSELRMTTPWYKEK